MRRFSFAPRALACWAVVALALTQTSCGVFGYAGDRLMDIPDIIDVKYGVGVGVGVKAEATVYMGAGAGLGALGYTREWFGRRSTVQQSRYFVHFGVGGVDGGRGAVSWYEKAYGTGDLDELSERADVHILLANLTTLHDHNIEPRGEAGPVPTNLWRANAPPSLDRWRFGAEFLIPVIQFGIYVNLGEIVDLVGGIFTWDPAYDDGVSITELYYDYRTDPYLDAERAAEEEAAEELANY